MNGVNISKSFDYAIIGGNIEIIGLITQQGFNPTITSAELAYKSNKNEILDWVLQTVGQMNIRPVMSINIHHIELFKKEFELNMQEEAIM